METTGLSVQKCDFSLVIFLEGSYGQDRQGQRREWFWVVRHWSRYLTGMPHKTTVRTNHVRIGTWVGAGARGPPSATHARGSPGCRPVCPSCPQVNLVSEHIWCEDFLVRSLYLKNLQTNETRTVTQFHFLSWYDQGVPSSTRSLLDFRR